MTSTDDLRTQGKQLRIFKGGPSDSVVLSANTNYKTAQLCTLAYRHRGRQLDGHAIHFDARE